MPSPPDHKITKQLFVASQIMDILLMDHLIVASDAYFSFADVGQMEKYKSIKSFRLT